MSDIDEKKSAAPPQSPSRAAKLDSPVFIATDEEFYYPDGNFRLLVQDRIFSVHKYKIEEFVGIKSRINVNSIDLDFIELPGLPDDFRNTFRVLYSSSYTPTDHATPVLISTLRVATNFEHSGLRAFAIRQLELKSLSPTDLIPIARECEVPEWETKALDKLTARTEPVTLQEAQILGLEAFVKLASQREKRLSRRRPMNTVSVVLPISRSSSPEVIDETPTPPNNTTTTRRGRPPSERIAESGRRKVKFGNTSTRTARTQASSMGVVLSSRGGRCR